MITILPDECLLGIFNTLRINYRTLFSCLFVSRHWCRIIISILWSEPTKYFDDLRLVRIYLSALNAEEQALLIPFDIVLPNYSSPLFEYSSFATYVGFYFVDRDTDGVKNWLCKEGYEDVHMNNDYNYYDDYSYYNYDYHNFNEKANAIKYSLISMFLRTSKKLKHLNVNEPIYNKILIEKLQKNTTITSLKLRINNLESIELLSEFIDKNTTLTSLDISRNALGFKEMQKLIKALHENTTLISLNLDYNSLFSKGGNALAEILCKNTTLTSLSVRQNQLGSQGSWF
ncbi:RNI-like protein [Gigaspora margarita]|uniref:RNI-like protein n=1 Tax=Gigaspora margarita TaxID=4874 RepID=A0A8H4AB34_GIGMA|nr:RNI-like protein [Gigaspora margarita]